MNRASWTKADYQVAIIYSIAAIILVYYIYYDWVPYILHRLSLQFEKRSVLQALSEEIARDEGATTHDEEILPTESLAAESDSSDAAHTLNPKYRLGVPIRLNQFPTNKASTRESDDHSKVKLRVVLNKSNTLKPPKFKIKSKPNDGSDADFGSQLTNPSRSSNENLRGGLNVDSIEARLHQSIVNERVRANAQTFGFYDVIDTISNIQDANSAARGDNVNIDTRTAIRIEQDREYQASMEEDQRAQEAKQALQSKREMVESRRMLLQSSLRAEPVEDKSNRDTITLSFRCKTVSSLRFNRRFSASTSTAGELLDFIEGLELKPLLESSFKLQLDFPLRVICRSINETESKLLDLGIDTDSVVHVLFDDDEVSEG